jgi:hypothetical protein
MKTKKNKPRKQAAGRPMLQIKTTIDFGEDGIPLERLGEITKLLKERHTGTMSQVKPGFVPIRSTGTWTCTCRAIPRWTGRNSHTGSGRPWNARKAGARCACGTFIWTIGSAEARAACFTCITGEAWPDTDYEIDEALGLLPG